MHFAAKCGSAEIIEELKSNKEVDFLAQTSDTQKTALHIAAEHNHIHIIKILLD